MDQQQNFEPALSAALSSVDAAMHDGMTQMGNAAKGMMHTMFDLSLEAVRQCQQFTDQNIDLYTEIQDAFLRNARQVHETNLKLWTNLPLSGWIGVGSEGNGLGTTQH
jgi:hypothetical protein